MAGASGSSFVFYRYDPSIAAAAVFTVLFGLSSLLHLFQLFRNRTWYFIPFVIGGLCEAIGYIGRIISAKQTPNWTSGPYIVQSLLILIAPTLFSASAYMILGRLIRLIGGERLSLIPTRWLTKVFVASDIFSFLLQSAGGGILASAKKLSNFQTGEDVIIGGLFVQLVGFGCFIAVTAVFHARILRHPTADSMSVSAPWRRYILVLYFVSAMILIRSLVRVIEYIQGYNGTLQSSEVWLYMFDTTPMFLAMLILNIYHPSQIISAKSKESVDAPDRRAGVEQHQLA